MTMKSHFMSYVVLLLVSFSVIHSNHALELVHEESGAIQGRALIPKLNYTITPNRKLQLVPDAGDGDGTGNFGGGDGTGNFGDFGGGDGTGNVGGGVGDVSGGNVGDGIGNFGDVGGGDGTGNVGGGVGDVSGGNDGNVGDGIGNFGDVGGGDGTGNVGGVSGGNVGGSVGDFSGGDGSDNRIGEGSCSKESIHVSQGVSDPLPSGIPTFSVIVENLCYSESCSISNIHLSCGWFSSARLINPKIFRRLNYNDCLVNDGQPLTPGQALPFTYANSHMYPLDVSSVQC